MRERDFVGISSPASPTSSLSNIYYRPTLYSSSSLVILNLRFILFCCKSHYFQYNLPFLLGASSRVVEMLANTCLYKSMIREWFCIWRRLMSNHEHEASSQHCDFLLFVVVKGLIKGRLVQVFSYIQGARLVSSVHHPRRRLPRIVQFLQQACLGGIHKANLFARGGGDE